MRIRRIDTQQQVVELHDGKRDLNYRFIAGNLIVSYTTERKKKNERKMRMSRELDPNGKKAQEIRAILNDGKFTAQ
jgi:hypothetical protein